MGLLPRAESTPPPGLIALDLQQTFASRTKTSRRSPRAERSDRATASALRKRRSDLGLGAGDELVATDASEHPSCSGRVAMGLPGISPSEGGLHAIREESWTSSLDSRSQGATGSTRSRGTASAVTASPIEANFPIEQLEEVAVPHRPSNGSLGGSRYGQRGGTN